LGDDAFFAVDAAQGEELKRALSATLSGAEDPAPPGQGDPVPPDPVLALGAPRRVVLEAPLDAPECAPEGAAPGVRADFPLLIGTRTTVLGAWQVDAEPNLHVLVVVLETGATQLGIVFRTQKRM